MEDDNLAYFTHYATTQAKAGQGFHDSTLCNYAFYHCHPYFV